MANSNNAAVIYILNIRDKFSDQLCNLFPVSESGFLKLESKNRELNQRQFIVSRALIKYAYQEWIKLQGVLAPQEIDISEGLRPSIIGRDDVAVSVSHSGSFVAILLSLGLGAIDIQVKEVQRDLAGIMKFSFHSDEVAYIENTASHEDLVNKFYEIWTMRECYFKLGVLEFLTDKNFSCFTAYDDLSFSRTTINADEYSLSYIVDPAVEVQRFTLS